MGAERAPGCESAGVGRVAARYPSNYPYYTQEAGQAWVKPAVTSLVAG